MPLAGPPICPPGGGRRLYVIKFCAGSVDFMA
jgi:hypothetical protein